ncbi:MAG: 16S rRNA (cytidine(1402)-2'-O)-methyltransferase [Candidatus Magasanikbacteria bacterium]|nr:16S rRNA (cytidine(1402)-2'-O)-methyltransferase [Candidatus Magasanikbacteria bacterium]
MPGTLYIVATPVGNLGDITLRAIETLKKVDLILCEDTRHTLPLLTRFGIKKPLISYHQHSSAAKIKEIVNLLNEGKKLALVTDAGTPGISDPGNLLIEELLKKDSGLKIIPLPGATALIAALSVSGFPADKFYFAGFPPQKKKRRAFFEDLAGRRETVVFYESPRRILKTLDELGEILGPRHEIMAARELTKHFETIYRGSLDSVEEKIKKDSPRGEFVVLIKKEGKTSQN